MPLSRTIARIDDPKKKQGYNELHQARELVKAGHWADTDPFLLLAEDWFPRGVFDRHPHRGLETVTYVIDGRIDHFDNQGNAGSILPGDAQWMTVGRGLIHNEIPAEDTTVHSLQLWVNLPASKKLTDPRYQDLSGDRMPRRIEPGVEVRVFSGSSAGVSAPTLNHAAVTMVEIRLRSGADVVQDLPSDYNGFVFVIEGRCAIGEQAVREGQVAWLSRPDTREAAESQVRISAPNEACRLLLFAGRPLNEPVVAKGPFVMNTEAEIEQAFADYRAGRFGA